MSEYDAEHSDGAAQWEAASAEAEPAHPAQAAVTPADAADAARLVAYGLQPKLLPARDADYADLLRRHRDEPAFA
ncbi:membrane protein, partial [Streptomyces varsoviensis]